MLGPAGSVAVGAGPEEPAAPPGQAAQSEQAERPPLERLGATIDDLTARLHAVRKSLADMRDADVGPTPPSAQGQPDASALASLRTERDQALAERDRIRATAAAECAARQGAEAWSLEDTARLRNELAKVMAELGRMRRERATLESRVAELQEAAAKGGASKVVAGPSGRDPETPLPAASRATGAKSLPSGSAAANRAADPASDTLQLEAQLAVAELKIAGLVSDLRTAQASREAIEAEAASLRALTDARIRQIIEAGPTASR
jgi:uncharacterized protein involved in exopolysaccharide biosynthesis